MALNVDAVPTLGRPAEVDQALSEASELRARGRAAQEELAAAQALLEQAQRDDVNRAAELARKGSPLGDVPAAVEKARHQVELAQRAGAALTLATDAAVVDAEQVIRDNADGWLATVDDLREQARQRGLAAVAELEQAARDVSDTAGAARWLRDGLTQAHFDPHVVASMTGLVARSSARATANNQPIELGQLVAYCRELFEPPETAAKPRIHMPARSAS
jgi:hypothetical protein